MNTGVDGPAHPRGRVLAAVSSVWFIALMLNQAYTLVLLTILPAMLAGIVNYGTALASMVFYVLDFGLNTSMVVAFRKRGISLGSLVRVSALFRGTGTLIAGAVLALGLLTGFLPAAYAWFFALTWVGFVLRLLQTPFYVKLQVSEAQPTVSVIWLGQAAARLMALPLLAMLGRLGLIHIAATGAIVDLSALLAFGIVASSRTHEEGPHADTLVEVVALLRAAPMLTAAGLVQVVQSRADWLMVGLLASYTALANYAIANKGLELFILFGSNFGRTALPWLVGGWGEARISRSVQGLIAASTLGGALMVVLGAEAVRMMFASKYPMAQEVIPILGALTPAMVLAQVVQFALLARGNASLVVVAGTAAVVVQLAVDFMAIPKAGIRGAAFGMAAFAAIQTVSLIFAAARRGVFVQRNAAVLLAEVSVLPILLSINHAVCALRLLGAC